MTKLLSMDTSSESCSVALAIDGETSERFELAPLRHAELIIPMVESLLADADLALNQLDAIAFGRGPGSFTGLRIGIGAVQGLAWGGQLPVVPVSSLAAVAQAFFDQHARTGLSKVCVAMDARMQEVYTAQFKLSPEGLVTPTSAERVCPPDDVKILEESATGAAGNGFERYDILARRGVELAQCHPDCWPHASAIGRLASSWLLNHAALAPDLAQPVYIRDKVAEKPS